MITKDIFINRTNRYFEYLIVRYDFIGRGISGEFNFLDVNGERVIKPGGKGDKGLWGAKETELFSRLGNAGWELVNHSVQDQPETTQITFHYAKFVRELSLQELGGDWGGEGSTQEDAL